MADRAALRARRRQLMTGENYQQARDHLDGADGIPDAADLDQVNLEAAVLAELDDVYGGQRSSDLGVYGIIRVCPTPTSLTITPAEGTVEYLLNHLLPEDDPDNLLTIAGIPGLRVAVDRRNRLRLHRPGGVAAVTVQLAGVDVDAAHAWLSEVNDPMRTSPDWTAGEKAQLLPHRSWVGDPMPRSRLLRRLLAFTPLPSPALIGPDSETPTLTDIAQLVHARQDPVPSPSPRLVPTAARIPVTPGDPVLLAVVSADVRGPASGGLGRTTTVTRLAAALTEAGLRVMVCSTDPYGFRPLPTPPGVVALSQEPRDGGFAASVRSQARGKNCDIVLLDAGPQGQLAIAAAADHWIGVAALWTGPDSRGGLLTEQAVDAAGRALASGWADNWLATMRAHQWRVTTRVEVSDPPRLLAHFDLSRCVGVFLAGGSPRTAAVVRAQLDRRLPVLGTHIPNEHGPLPATTDAYAALTAELMGR